MSHPVLSSEEIDALMEGFGSSPAHELPGDKGERFSIARLSNHPWSALDVAHKQFAVRLAAHLSRQCGRHLDVESRPAEEMAHGRFVRELAPRHVALSAPTLRGSGILLAVLDENGARRYSDLLFGGDGLGTFDGAAGLSPVEQSVAWGLLCAVVQIHAQGAGQALTSDLRATPVGPEGGICGCLSPWTRMVNAQFVIKVGLMSIDLAIVIPVQEEVRPADVDGKGLKVSCRTNAWTNQTPGDNAVTKPSNGISTRNRPLKLINPQIRTARRGARVGSALDSRRVHKLAWTGRAE